MGAPDAGAESPLKPMDKIIVGQISTLRDCGRYQKRWMCCAAHGEPMTEQTSGRNRGPCRGIHTEDFLAGPAILWGTHARAASS